MRLFRFVLSTLTVMILVMAVFTIGPWIETKYFPVYSKFRIVDADQAEDGVMLTVRFTKNRTCDPQGFGWYVGEFGLLRQMVTRPFGSGTVHRPLGPQLLGPFLVKDLMLEELPYIYAETYHHCHPLWLSRSVIYP